MIEVQAIRHPLELTDSCLIYRWNPDLNQAEIWYNYGWRRTHNYVRCKTKEELIKEINDFKYKMEDIYVEFDDTWAEPYEELSELDKKYFT